MLNKDINLLPIDIISTRESRKKSKRIIFVSISIIVVISIVIFTLYSSIEQLESKKRELQKNIANYTDTTGDGEIANGGQNKTIHLQNALSKIQSQEYDNTLFLSLLESKTPKDAIINSIVVLGNEVTINGIAPDEEIIANFIYNIKGFDIIENVHLSSIMDSGKNNKSFTLRCIRTKSSSTN